MPHFTLKVSLDLRHRLLIFHLLKISCMTYIIQTLKDPTKATCQMGLAHLKRLPTLVLSLSFIYHHLQL